MPTKTIKGALIALVLSVVFPGMGQAYNRQPRKGAIFAALSPGLLLLAGLTGILHSFVGLVLFLSLSLSVALIVHGDALFNGYWDRRRSLSGPSPLWAYVPVILLAGLNFSQSFAVDFLALTGCWESVHFDFLRVQWSRPFMPERE